MFNSQGFLENLSLSLFTAGWCIRDSEHISWEQSFTETYEEKFTFFTRCKYMY